MDAALGGYEAWDGPLRLLGAVHWLVLRGDEPDAFRGWDEFRSVLSERREELARLVRDRPVQTNEVRRSWLLVPCFLEAAARADADVVDVIELGASAGLNLVWDRYRYRYAEGTWGPADAPLALDGEEHRPVPARLLARPLRVRRRVGVDQDPLDVSTEDGAVLLKSFVWADQHDRIELLDRAIETLRRSPPPLVRGDFVDVLPSLLAEGANDTLTIVFSTATRGYVPEERWRLMCRTVDEAARVRPLAFVYTARPRDDTHEYWGMWLQTWPGGEREVVAHAEFHGAWLDWLG